MKLIGELDTIVLTSASQEVGSLGGGAVTRLVRLDEASTLASWSASVGVVVTTSAVVALMISSSLHR